MINARYIDHLKSYFITFAKKEATRFRNLGIITNTKAMFYLDDDGKITFDPQKYAIYVYYNKPSNTLFGDAVLNNNIVEKAFSYKMPRPLHIFDRSKWTD